MKEAVILSQCYFLLYSCTLTQLHTNSYTGQSLSQVRLFVNPWTAALQASLSITNSQSLLRLMSIESVMPHNHLILCCPLLLLYKKKLGQIEQHSDTAR